MTSGPVVALELVGANSVKNWRRLLGPTDSRTAREEAPGSVRAKFGKDKTNNAAHGSDSAEAAKRVSGIILFFHREWYWKWVVPRLYLTSPNHHSCRALSIDRPGPLGRDARLNCLFRDGPKHPLLSILKWLWKFFRLDSFHPSFRLALNPIQRIPNKSGKMLRHNFFITAAFLLEIHKNPNKFRCHIVLTKNLVTLA